MKKLKLFISTLLMMCAASTSAHGPVRQKLQERIQINASANKVWSVLKDFDSVDWLPMVESVTGEGGNTIKATRILTLNGGKTITESLKKYDAKKMSYAYKITDMTIVDTVLHAGVDEPIKVLPVTDYAASITVKAKSDGAEVIWKAAYYRGYMNNNPPAVLNEDAARLAIQGVFRAGLEGLKQLSESSQATNKSPAKKKTKNKKQLTPVAITSTTAFDADYPAASFQPKIIYSDKTQVKAKTNTGEKSVFDSNYPAANFEPKVIFP